MWYIHITYINISLLFYISGSGKARAEEAARAAISSPLLDFPIERARGVVFNIVGGDDLTLQEVRVLFIIFWTNFCFIHIDVNITSISEHLLIFIQ